MRKFLSILALPLAFLFVAFMRFNPWVLIRFGELWSTRIGHLVANTECYLCEKDAGLHPKSYDIWFHHWKPCNNAVAKKYEQVLHVWPAWLCILVIKVNVLFRGWEKHSAKSAQVDRDIYNLWGKYAPHIGFTKNEEKKGEKILRQLGIPEGAKWVCLIVRDSSYLKQKYPMLDFSYHDYRDADIGAYAQSVLGLVSRGYYVVRMGEIVQKPLLIKHPKFIDYAGSKHQSNFADLYIGANCTFCYGTPTGFMTIPQVFGRPLAMTDFVPIEHFTTSVDGLLIWKHHIKDGKELDIRGIFDSGISLSTFGAQYEIAGVKLQNNTPKEIYDVVMEMADRMEFKRDCSDQSDFWQKFPTSMQNGKPMHGRIDVRIGREYLNAYRKL